MRALHSTGSNPVRVATRVRAPTELLPFGLLALAKNLRHSDRSGELSVEIGAGRLAVSLWSMEN